MRPSASLVCSQRAAGARRLLLGLIAALAGPGCRHERAIEFAADTKPPPLRLVQPQARTIVRVVGQPSFIESYERTSIYPKPTAYIENWKVDIGDKVNKVDVLATLFAPELVEELQTKKANVVLDQQKIALAKELVEVAKADVTAAEARVSEAEAILDKYQSEVDRWDTEVKRLERQVAGVVVNRQVLVESTNQLNSSIAARDQAKATIKRAKAELRAAQAKLAKAQVDVRVAEAALKVAESEEQYAQAWVDYLTLTAPFSGVISARNANTFDFVLPTTGDPTAFFLSPDISPSGAAAPIYVVDRLDIVRIFIDIPERDANFVNVGTKATVLARAFRDKELPATVTRIAWALNQKSRTLRAEIDLPNPNSRLLPGMYAYVTVIIERPDVRALPLESLVHNGDQTFCWLCENGKAVKTELETGISDDDWIEVTNRRPPVPPEAPSDSVPWTPIDGREQVIVGDLSALVDGAPVNVKPAGPETKTASDARVRDAPRAEPRAERAPKSATASIDPISKAQGESR
jgi:multidrug efflux pump subunit AcrA (membrane-fusion protein)